MSILWILAVVGLAPAIIAVRAYVIERREGLRRSTTRAIGAPAIAAALIALAWCARPVVEPVTAEPAAPTAPTAPTTERPPDPRIAELRGTLVELERRRAELDSEIARVNAELRRRQPAPTSPAPAPPRTEPRPAGPQTGPATWSIYAAVALLIASLGLLWLGDLATLLPSRPAGKATTAGGGGPTITTLVDHVSARRWTEALDVAADLRPEQLSKLDLLDLCFLHAFCRLMSVSAPEASTPVLSREQRDERLSAAIADLDRLLELAPHMAEAIWLRAHIQARQGAWQDALDGFRRTRSELADLPFDHDESVCLLHLAEQRMANADNDGATRLFEEVSRLGVLASHVPAVMVSQRIFAVRAHIKASQIGAAAEAIQRIRQIEGLDDNTRRAVTTACDVYELAIRHRSGKLQEALDADIALLAARQPDRLPDVEDQVADEFLHPAVDRATLRMPAELYRALYFLEAVLRIELAAARGGALSPETVDLIAIALLRALQFEPRHREVLAALAALYLAYRKERTERALPWLESALSLGVRSRAARTLYTETRRAETERKELLAVFRVASTRLLSDPSLAPQVRSALIDELGRFHDFRPVVLDIQTTGALELPAPDDLTISGLHGRAAFVAGVANEVIQRWPDTIPHQLLALHRELDALAASVDSSARRIGAVERAVMEQLGQLLLR